MFLDRTLVSSAEERVSKSRVETKQVFSFINVGIICCSAAHVRKICKRAILNLTRQMAKKS